MNPNEPIKEPNTPETLNVGEGAEAATDYEWEQTTDQQNF